MPTVLFVCQANRYRSPIAAACFRAIAANMDFDGAAWKVASAGTWTQNGLPALPKAIKRAARLGLDIRDHRSRVVTAEILERADLIIVMEAGQKEALSVEFPMKKDAVYLLSEVTAGIAYDIPDPVHSPDAGDVVGEICSLIRTGGVNIIKLWQAGNGS